MGAGQIPNTQLCSIPTVTKFYVISCYLVLGHCLYVLLLLFCCLGVWGNTFDLGELMET